MTVRFKNELFLISALVILLIIIITFFQSSVLRVILGLPFLLFLPGYALIAALFPKRNALDSIERVALSFALSIAVVAFIGFLLNFTLWGITLYPILISLTIFIITTSALAWFQRQRLAEEDRPGITFTLSLRRWREQSRFDKILSAILIVTILVTAGTIGYAITTPGETERFTEFYVLGPEGKAEGYPNEMTMGQTATVIVGIINHESEDMSYRLEITIGKDKPREITGLTLKQEEKWEQEVFFTPVRAGREQEVAFVLYKNGKSYRQLSLWINVKGTD